MHGVSLTHSLPLSQVSQKAAGALAEPSTHPELFPDLDWAVRVEDLFKQNRHTVVPAAVYVPPPRPPILHPLVDSFPLFDLKSPYVTSLASLSSVRPAATLRPRQTWTWTSSLSSSHRQQQADPRPRHHPRPPRTSPPLPQPPASTYHLSDRLPPCFSSCAAAPLPLPRWPLPRLPRPLPLPPCSRALLLVPSLRPRPPLGHNRRQRCGPLPHPHLPTYLTQVHWLA